ncbi:MAG: hypothetical protein ACRCY5_00035 [Phocaeicola sp.]
MRRRSTIQRTVATGKFTLPVAILVSISLWLSQAVQWSEALTCLIFCLTGYLIIELNTSYSLIRTRTTFHITLYTILTGCSLFLLPFNPTLLTTPLFLLAIHQLLRAYESEKTVTPIFHAFLFLGISIYIDPHFVTFIPLLGLGTLMFNSFSTKGFFAGLMGLVTPYWFLLTYALVKENFSLIKTPLQAILELKPFDYQSINIGLESLLLVGTILFLTIVCTLYYLNQSYLDKSRTRTFIYFLLLCQLNLYVSTALFPQEGITFFSLLLPFTALISAHFFTLTNNRFSNLFFIAIFVTLITVTIYYVWMH